MTQHTSRRQISWLIAASIAAGSLLLAGCSGGGDTTSTGGAASGFAFAFPQANDSEDFYQKLAQEYQSQTGVQIELLPIPGNNLSQQINTQLQAGNGPDLFVVPPGAGQASSIIPLAKAGFLAPLDTTSAGLVPKGTESLYSLNGTTYGQPTSLTPDGFVYNDAKAKSIGIANYPDTFESYLDACGTAASAGVTMTVIAGSVPLNLGLLAEAISATRVYAANPDWNQLRADKKVTFADSGWRQVLDDIVTMKDKGCFQAGAEGGTFDSLSGGLIGATALSAPIPGSAATALSGASQGAVSLDVRPIPPSTGQTPWILASPLYAWVSNAKSDSSVQQAVQKFLDWAAQPQQTEQFANLSGAIPVGSPSAQLLPQFSPVSQMISSGSFSPEPNLGWPNSAVFDTMGTGIQGLLTGQTTVDDLLKAMDTAWDQ